VAGGSKKLQNSSLKPKAPNIFLGTWNLEFWAWNLKVAVSSE
jgi:hypothetical protein